MTVFGRLAGRRYWVLKRAIVGDDCRRCLLVEERCEKRRQGVGSSLFVAVAEEVGCLESVVVRSHCLSRVTRTRCMHKSRS